MAERRMFSKRIINSGKFLKMPISSQALYFHLGINADDDGIVEAYNVVNSIKGCSEDDLRVLVSKGFVQVLNEDLVTYITDWTENNKIRADRKIDSIYKDLLLSINPDIRLLEKRQRADSKPKIVEMDNQRTSNGQPMDSIGKDRIGKDRIEKDNISSKEMVSIPYTYGSDTSVSVSDSVSVSEKPKKPKKVKHKYGEYGHVALTDEEYSRLVSDYGEPGVKAGITKVDKYCQKSGKTYRDYNLVLRDWGIEAPKIQKPKEVVIDPEDEARQKAWEEGFHDA